MPLPELYTAPALSAFASFFLLGFHSEMKTSSATYYEVHFTDYADRIDSFPATVTTEFAQQMNKVDYRRDDPPLMSYCYEYTSCELGFILSIFEDA